MEPFNGLESIMAPLQWFPIQWDQNETFLAYFEYVILISSEVAQICPCVPGGSASSFSPNPISWYRRSPNMWRLDVHQVSVSVMCFSLFWGLSQSGCWHSASIGGTCFSESELVLKYEMSLCSPLSLVRLSKTIVDFPTGVLIHKYKHDCSLHRTKRPPFKFRLAPFPKSVNLTVNHSKKLLWFQTVIDLSSDISDAGAGGSATAGDADFEIIKLMATILKLATIKIPVQSLSFKTTKYKSWNGTSRKLMWWLFFWMYENTTFTNQLHTLILSIKWIEVKNYPQNYPQVLVAPCFRVTTLFHGNNDILLPLK